MTPCRPQPTANDTFHFSLLSRLPHIPTTNKTNQTKYVYPITMASNLSTQLSPSERQYILDGCADNCRNDGRTRQEIRPYTIVTSSETTRDSGSTSEEGYPPLILSNGSARLFLSSSGAAATHILCSVKAELGHPSEDNPYEGNIQIHVEDSLGGAALSRRQSQEERNYLQAIIAELLAPNLLDLKSLCIMPHHYAFTINIDVEILSGTAGNLIDACGHTIRAALQNTLLPSIVPSSTAASSSTGKEPTGSTSSDLLLDSDIRQATTPAGLERAPVVVTVTVCQRPSSSSSTAANGSFLLLLDASLEEESCSFCQVHVAVDPGDADDNDNAAKSEPEICALRKTGTGSLPWALLPDITALAMTAVPTAKAAFQTSKSTSESQGLLQGQFAIQ